MTKKEMALAIAQGHNISEHSMGIILQRANEKRKESMERIYNAYLKDKNNWAFYIALFSDLYINQ